MFIIFQKAGFIGLYFSGKGSSVEINFDQFFTKPQVMRFSNREYILYICYENFPHSCRLRNLSLNPAFITHRDPIQQLTHNFRLKHMRNIEHRSTLPRVQVRSCDPQVRVLHRQHEPPEVDHSPAVFHVEFVQGGHFALALGGETLPKHPRGALIPANVPQYPREHLQRLIFIRTGFDCCGAC